MVDVRSELPKMSGLSFLKYISRKALVHPTLLSGLNKAGTAASNLLGGLLPKESGLRLRLIGFEKGVLHPPADNYINL